LIRSSNTPTSLDPLSVATKVVKGRQRERGQN
jgi:hypothetical protein